MQRICWNSSPKIDVLHGYLLTGGAEKRDVPEEGLLLEKHGLATQEERLIAFSTNKNNDNRSQLRHFAVVIF
jgi:hypothetical protein